MGPPSATLFVPDDLDLLALMHCPGVDINYVMKNALIVFAEEVYETALQLMGKTDRIDVYDIPRDVYEKAIRMTPANVVRHKALATERDMHLVWMTNCAEPMGFYIPVPNEIPGHVLEDTKIHCYISEQNNQPAVRLWNELRRGHKSNFIKTIIRFYLERPIIEPRFFPEAFPSKKTGITKSTGAVGKRTWVKNQDAKKTEKHGDAAKTEEEKTAGKEDTGPAAEEQARPNEQPQNRKTESSNTPAPVITEVKADTAKASVTEQKTPDKSEMPEKAKHGTPQAIPEKPRKTQGQAYREPPAGPAPAMQEDDGDDGDWNIFDAMNMIIKG